MSLACHSDVALPATCLRIVGSVRVHRLVGKSWVVADWWKCQGLRVGRLDVLRLNHIGIGQAWRHCLRWHHAWMHVAWLHHTRLHHAGLLHARLHHSRLHHTGLLHTWLHHAGLHHGWLHKLWHLTRLHSRLCHMTHSTRRRHDLWLTIIKPALARPVTVIGPVEISLIILLLELGS